MISRENYFSAIENFEKEINPEYSLSMRTHSNEQILKNKTYFVFMIFKIALLELLFIPIRLKRVLKVKW